MMKKKIFLLLFPVLVFMLFFSLSAHATLIESGLPGGGQPDLLKPGNTTGTITPAQYVRYLYLFVMGFVGIAGLVTLVIWGTVWTASGVVDKKAAAMEGIKNTLYGIGIALTAYILLATINPDLTVIKLPTLITTPQGKNGGASESWDSQGVWVCHVPRWTCANESVPRDPTLGTLVYNESGMLCSEIKIKDCGIISSPMCWGAPLPWTIDYTQASCKGATQPTCQDKDGLTDPVICYHKI